MDNSFIKNLKIYKKNFCLAGIVAINMVLSTACDTEYENNFYDIRNAVISNNGNSVVVPIKYSNEYKGEAVEIKTLDGMSILTSSYFTNLIKSQKFSSITEDYAKSIVDKNGTLSYYGEVNNTDQGFSLGLSNNEDNFNKAIIIHNNKAIIIPVKVWSDYDGEQIQIVTPEDVVILTSNYKTILINDNTSEKKASDLAKMIVSENGTVLDTSGDYVTKYSNYQKSDSKKGFNKAILLGDTSNCILSLDTWKDYDGEQFQVNIYNGPTLVSSSFNSILVNDIHGQDVTTRIIAEALNENVVSYIQDINQDYLGNNKQFFDFNYNFQNAAITNGENSVILPLESWNDYDGEQLQFNLTNGLSILSSSIDSMMASYSDKKITVDSISRGIVKNPENSKNLDPNYINKSHNSKMFDTNYNFPYALVINDKSILILSLDSWYDHYDSEQIELTLTDKTTTFLTTAYDTKLVNLGNSRMTIQEVASLFNDGNKKVVDLSGNTLGEGKHINGFFKNSVEYNYAVSINNDVATILPIEKCIDSYSSQDSDGNYTDYTEEIQIITEDGNTIHSNNTNTKLISSKDITIVEKIALGHLSEDGIINNISKDKTPVKTR